MNRNRTKIVLTVAVVALTVLAGTAQAELMGQLGLLDLTADYGAGAGNNPATGNPWAPSDPYHLIYVTSTTRDATSTDIADYNAFAQADADAEGIGASVGVSWTALGSTETVDAKDNTTITGPVFTAYLSKYTAVDAADFWDLLFPTGGIILTLGGESKMAWTGTGGGGTAFSPLGGTSVTWEWTGWQDWASANKWETSTELAPLVPISEELNIVPEPSTFALAVFGLLGLIGFARRRRK